MVNKLEEIYSQIPKSTCPPGCGQCCGILFPSLAEIRNIKEWCEKRHIEYHNFNMTVGLDCPYLGENKECKIYPVRPFLCRMMGVSNLPCPISKCHAHRILNVSQSHALYKQIYYQGKEKRRTEKHQKSIIQILKKEGLQ
jgi:Fe-S-cluster containining protein